LPVFRYTRNGAHCNPRVVKLHEKDGDWGAAWLASNEAGSGAYRLIPSTYVPLEHVDMEKYDEHFLGWSDNPQPIKKIEWCRRRSPRRGYWRCSTDRST
jgi:hypothetical protein